MTRETAIELLRNEAYIASKARGLTHEQAEDAASDVVLEILRLSFRPTHRYAKGLIRNVVTDHVAAAARHREHTTVYGEERLEAILDEQASDEEALIDAILAKQAFEGLPSLHAATVAALVRHVTPHTHYGADEVGAELGVSEGRARHRVMDARRHAAEAAADPSTNAAVRVQP